MNYYDSMQSLIGNTPLVRLGNIVQAEGVNVFAKLELYNPSGSVNCTPPYSCIPGAVSSAVSIA